MKKKILFGLLGLVVAMFTMTACSNDDDDNNGGASGLKLTSIETSEEGPYGWKENVTNTYDEQGRIKKYSWSYNGKKATYTYDYQGNTIKMTEYDGDDNVEGTTTKYTLENGVITKGVMTNDEGEVVSNYNFSYDKDGQLVSIVMNAVGSSSTYEATIVWKNGNIESLTEKEGSTLYQYTCKYTSESAVKGLVVGFWGLEFDIFDDEEYMLFKLGYFGKQPKNLLASVHENRPSNNSDYTYTYGFEGKDGYVSSRTITRSYELGGTTTYVEKYTWE